MDSPLHHFEVHTIIPIHIGGLDLSINNAIVAMWVGLAIVAGSFILVVSRGVSPIPGKLQSILDDDSQSDAVRSAAGKAIKEVAPRRKFGD